MSEHSIDSLLTALAASNARADMLSALIEAHNDRMLALCYGNEGRCRDYPCALDNIIEVKA